MAESAKYTRAAPAILLALTCSTGIVDAVSFLALGRVFTANMTGNTVLLGFAIGGTVGISIPRSLLALGCFFIGALLGGALTSRMTTENRRRSVIRAFVLEAFLLAAAAIVAVGLTAPYEHHPLKMQAVVVASALAMGLRNAMIRKVGVADLTTTVLTMTLTGLAADSALVGGDNVRWGRRCAAVLAMLGGATAGALLLRVSVALPLSVCVLIAWVCAFAWSRIE
jgi:uncharacterized membrane protein YoaK (UPF0700 family)